MSDKPFHVAQAAQARVQGGVIGFYGVGSADGKLSVELGAANAEGRHQLTIGVGDTEFVAGFGSITVLDVHIGAQGKRSQALLRFSPVSQGGEA